MYQIFLSLVNNLLMIGVQDIVLPSKRGNSPNSRDSLAGIHRGCLIRLIGSLLVPGQELDVELTSLDDFHYYGRQDLPRYARIHTREEWE
jgi:hypothetical protein